MSNQGRLNSVGEIGNILRGWDMSGDLFRTIRLYPRNNANANKMDQVFRYFCVRDDQQRGAVNVNTRQAEALDSVFLNTPMGFPATNPSLPMLTAVGPLVDAITNATALGEFHDVGDVGTNTVNWRALFPSMDDVSREAIIANSAGLLTVRQNLFIIVLRAESWSPGIGGVGGETLAGAHAVAEVWRDPFRDEDGNHRMFIRYFKMLED